MDMTDKVKSNNKTKKIKERTKKEVKVRGRKINNKQKSLSSTSVKKRENVKNTSKDSKVVVKNKDIINKTSVTYLLLFIFDIVLTIYMARRNVINYVLILDKKVRVSSLVYLLLGRNYINIAIMFFMYSYTCLINKYFLNRKNSIKFLSLLLIIVVALNLLLFFVFSNKVY